MIRYYVRDHTYEEDCGTGWGDFVLRLVAARGNSIEADSIIKSDNCDPRTETDTFKGENSIVFVHADGPESRGLWISATTNWLKGTVVFVSSKGRLNSNTLRKAATAAGLSSYARCCACFWSLPELNNVKNSRILALLESLKTSTPDLQLLQPPPTEDVLTLRILCEAWLATEGKPTASLNGITIHAPVTPEDWFKPFGEEPTKTAATGLADKMGIATDIRDNTAKLLSAAIDGTLAWANSKRDVEALRDALKSALR